MQLKSAQKKSYCALWLLLITQLGLFIGFYVWGDAKNAYSALIGGGANCLGQAYFLYKMRGPDEVLTPKALLQYFYRSELLKIVLILSLLAVLLKLFSLNLWSVFISFVVVQCVGSFAPLCMYIRNH
jgi:F0F1-type ATP synthase assembly protein I